MHPRDVDVCAQLAEKAHLCQRRIAYVVLDIATSERLDIIGHPPRQSQDHGNVVRGNYIHDTLSMAAGEAIRCDDDQHDTLIENNVVFRYGTHGIGICSKGRNHIFNNIVACPPHRVNRGMLSLEPTNNMVNAGSKIFHNIFYATQSNQPFVFKSGIEKVIGTIEIDRNIYFSAVEPNAAHDYLQWARKHGKEIRSKQVDPLFVDIENGNFQLKVDSPALGLGFRPFKLNAGRLEG